MFRFGHKYFLMIKGGLEYYSMLFDRPFMDTGRIINRKLNFHP
jgi:hypothetical protein